MRKILAVAFIVAVVVSASSSADARGGCGIGVHRGPHGGCRENGTNELVVAPHTEVVVGGAPAIGVFLAGHGYWDGHRYWGHRDRWRGGWRYR